MVDYYKEPTVHVELTDPRALRRFLAALVATVFFIATVLIGLSWYSNHYGYFGPEGQFAFYNDRLSKSEYLANLAPEELPQAYIIGSSNTMPILPASVERLYGLRTFNLGSFWGRAEDIWAWTNFVVRDLQKKPSLVILGVEPWTFADDNRGPPLLSMYQRRLLTAPRLTVYLPHFDPYKAEISQVLDSLTIENARLMAQMFGRYKGRRTANGPFWESGFNRDGTNTAYTELKNKAFLPDQVNAYFKEFIASKPSSKELDSITGTRLAQVEAWHLRLDDIVNFLPGDRMLPERQELFERAIAFLDENEVQVAVLIMPTHPYYYDMLVHYTRHAQHLEVLRQFLSGIQRQHSNVKVVFDASNIARFGGDPFAFHDHYHMTPANTDRMLAAMRAAQDSKHELNP